MNTGLPGAPTAPLGPPAAELVQVVLVALIVERPMPIAACPLMAVTWTIWHFNSPVVPHCGGLAGVDAGAAALGDVSTAGPVAARGAQ